MASDSEMDETLSYFTQLGDHVDQRWTAKRRSVEQLPEVASAALAQRPPPEGLSPETVLSLLASGAHMPKQRPSSDSFGQPPAVMYRGSDFEIQAITWMEGSTSIHDHGFDGAFFVVAGPSLHVRYAFERTDILEDGKLVLGQLTNLDSEVLWPGDVRSIVSGPDFIHALFHLGRPSMTIVVRNKWSDRRFPEYEYRLPGLGFDVLEKDDLLQMRLRGLHTLRRLDRSRAETTARGAVAHDDLWTAFRICDDWLLAYGEKESSELVDVLGTRASVLADVLEPMYAEEVRRRRIMTRRVLLHDSRHRLFLALVVNLTDRQSIFHAMGQLFPGEEPSEVLLRLLEELASPEYRGISGLNLSAEGLEEVSAHLKGGRVEDGLGSVAGQWRPPPLLDHLFS
jgi:hypothetical protein